MTDCENVVQEQVRGLGDWVLVPRVPTDAMLRAAQSAWLNDTLRRTTTMWRAMLEAAPRRPAAVDGEKETDLWRCTVCGRVGTVGRCCGEETRELFRPNTQVQPCREAAAALEAALVDAERYRWLRKGSNDDIAVVSGLGAMDYGMSGVAYTYSEEIDGDDLDAAIDAAMLKAREASSD